MINTTDLLTFIFVLLCFIGSILMKRAVATGCALAVSMGVIVIAVFNQANNNVPLNFLLMVPVGGMAIFEAYMVIIETFNGDLI